VAQFDDMLHSQHGMCAICGASPDAEQYGVLAVDHCHTTGKVRGLLCANCNNGLGRFKDNPEALEAAAAYLRKYREPLPAD
jgi:hypothetical protein